LIPNTITIVSPTEALLPSRARAASKNNAAAKAIP